MRTDCTIIPAQLGRWKNVLVPEEIISKTNKYLPHYNILVEYRLWYCHKPIMNLKVCMLVNPRFTSKLLLSGTLKKFSKFSNCLDYVIMQSLAPQIKQRTMYRTDMGQLLLCSLWLLSLNSGNSLALWETAADAIGKQRAPVIFILFSCIAIICRSMQTNGIWEQSLRTQAKWLGLQMRSCSRVNPGADQMTRTIARCKATTLVRCLTTLPKCSSFASLQPLDLWCTTWPITMYEGRTCSSHRRRRCPVTYTESTQ